MLDILNDKDAILNAFWASIMVFLIAFIFKFFAAYKRRITKKKRSKVYVALESTNNQKVNPTLVPAISCGQINSMVDASANDNIISDEVQEM